MNIYYKEFPELKTIEITIDGKFTSDDFDRIVPKITAFIAANGKIKLIEIIKDLKGFEMGAFSKGFKFDMQHLKDFSHCALVTNSGWIGPFTRIIAPFFSTDIRIFKIDQEGDARNWLLAAR